MTTAERVAYNEANEPHLVRLPGGDYSVVFQCREVLSVRWEGAGWRVAPPEHLAVTTIGEGPGDAVEAGIRDFILEISKWLVTLNQLDRRDLSALKVRRLAPTEEEDVCATY